MSDAAVTIFQPSWATPSLTAERVRSVRFHRTPLGRRGLDEEEVARFLERIAEELTRRDAIEAAERAEAQRYKKALLDWQSEQADQRDTGAADRPLGLRPDVEMVNMMSRAQQEADAYIAQTQAYCRQLAADAEAQADAIIDDARTRADDAAERAALSYRAAAGDHYSATEEELRRRLAWMRGFITSLGSVESQLSIARQALELEFEKIDDIARPHERV